MTDWKNQFEIVKQIIAEELARSSKKFTLANAAELLGVKLTKLQAWAKGQRPSADDLETMTRVLGLSAEWVLLGNGSPRTSTTREPNPSEASATVDGKDDPVVARANGIAELLIKHGASASDVRDGIMAVLKGAPETVRETRGLYTVNEADGPYDTK